MGVNIVKLKDVVDILNGYAFKSSKYVKSGHRVMRITNVQKGILVDDDPKYYEQSNELNKYELKIGDILISLTGNVGRVGMVEEQILPAYLNQRVGCLRIKSDKVFDRYLFHLLNNDSFEDNCIRISNGIAQLNMSTEWLKDVDINLPSLEEQKKIARILDKADEIRTKKRLANDKLDEFLKSTFISMFGNPVTNTKSLDIVKVIDVCDCMVPGRDKPKSFTGNIPWITIDDLKINSITYKSKNNMGLTDTEISEVKRKTIPTGSVIMSCVGNLGLCSIAGQPMVINQQLHSFQCSEKVNNIYLMFILGQMTRYMNKNASSTTVLYMNKTVCNSIPILLPNIIEQNKFAQIVEHVEAQKQKNEQIIEQMDNLFNSLSQRAFKGEL